MVDIVSVGPIGAAIIVGYTGDAGRFADRHHYASYNGTAAIDFSSGGRSAVQRGAATPQGCQWECLLDDDARWHKGVLPLDLPREKQRYGAPR